MVLKFEADRNNENQIMKKKFTATTEVAKLGIISFLVFGLLLVGYLYETHWEEQEVATNDSRNLSWALSEQARRAFEAADEILVNAEDHLKENDFTCGNNCGNQSRSIQINDMLKKYIARSRGLDALNIHDERGNLLYSSITPLPALNNSDRPYFQLIKSNPELERVFSEPLISRSTNKPTIILARRFMSKEGKFIGTLQANVGLGQFISIYKSLKLGEHSVISMRTIDGFHRMARYPEVTEEQEPMTKTLDHPLKFYLDKNQAQGSLEIVSPTDGLERTVSFHKIEQYPFYVEVGFAVNERASGTLLS